VGVVLNKKASLMDVFYVMGTFLIGIIVALVLVKVFSNVYDLFQDQTVNNTAAHQVFTDAGEGYPKWVDSLMFFLWLGLVLASVVLAFFVEYNPLFIGFSFLIYVLGVVYAWVVRRVIAEIAPSFATEYSVLPLLAFLSEHFIILHVIAFAAIIIAMYVRPARFLGGGL